MNPIARMMKRHIKAPLKNALPLLFIGVLVLTSTAGCLDTTSMPSPAATATPSQPQLSQEELNSMQRSGGGSNCRFSKLIKKRSKGITVAVMDACHSEGRYFVNEGLSADGQYNSL